jgi:hypothetical protein
VFAPALEQLAAAASALKYAMVVQGGRLRRDATMPFTSVNHAHQFLAAIRTLTKSQQNATSRRVIGLAENAISALDQKESVGQTDRLASETYLTLSDILEGLPGNKLSFFEVHNEVGSDRSRRSIFLDPEENALSSLLDLYAGTVSTLEIRSAEEVDFRALRERAIKLMRGRFPIVSVNLALARDIDEAIDILMQTARTLRLASNMSAYPLARAQGTRGMLKVDRNDFDVLTEMNRAAPVGGSSGAETEAEAGSKLAVKGLPTSVDRADGTPSWDDYRDCDIQLQSLGSDWDENGRRLTTMFTGKAICPQGGRDPYCGNDVYVTEYLGTWFEKTWSDGDPKFPPPQLPPPFESRQWNHDLALFDSPVSATLTSDWGWRQVGGVADFHPGIDLATAAGTQVYSTTDGEVLLGTGTGIDRGVHVIFQGRRYVYWHFEPDAALVTGQTIPAGTLLGTVLPWPNDPGRTHLHHAQYEPADQRDENSHDPLP